MKSTDEFDFFELDPNRLHEEWVAQPKLYHKYADRLADARNKYEQDKANLELIEAELSLEIRKDPLLFGLEKATEDAIKKAVLVQKKYREALVWTMKRKHVVDTMSAIVQALDHRKKALEKLVDLRLADYFSEPKESKRAKEESERKAFKGRQRISPNHRTGD